MVRGAREDITAFADFPEAHWRGIWKANPPSNASTARLSVAPTSSASSPSTAALQRLSACVLIQAHDEWQVSHRCYLSEASMAMLTPPEPTALTAQPTDPAGLVTTASKTA